MMPSPPVSQPKSIQYLLESLGERIELHPIYQRDIKWSQENMCDLIKTIMYNGFVPGILLYKLQAGDERAKDTYRTECVDGQHRFFTLLHFFNSEPVVLPGKKPFLIHLPYSEGGQTVHIFYKQTHDTEIWKAENRGMRAEYMTEEEKDHFNSFLLDIREIQSPLSLDQRRQLFSSLQKGVPVRGSDLYKNMTGVPLIKFISEEKRWEKPMTTLLREHCVLNPKQYWLHWLLPCYLIEQSADGDERVKSYMVKDAVISQMIKKGSPLLESTPESEAAFDAAIQRFFAFLGGLPAGVKLTPTQFYAAYTHLLDADEGREAILTSHMKDWSTAGMKPAERKMWENRGFEDEARKDSFERSVDELDRILVPAEEVGARKTMPKKLRDRVWVTSFGEAEDGECYCCKEAIAVTNWECAHKVAVKHGGKDEVSNLVPTCRTCNRSMGTEDLEIYKARYHPN